MNRFIYFLFLLPILFLFTFCSNDNDDDSLRVSSASTTVPEYSVGLITVSGGSGRHYYFQIENEEIISAELDYGNRLYIHGLIVGETGIIIRDGAGDSVRVEVKVVENNFYITVKQHEVIIEMNITDENIYNEIEQELLQSFPFPVGTVYKLRRQETLIDGDLTIYLPDEEKTEIKGTFRQISNQESGNTDLVFIYNHAEVLYSMFYGSIDLLKSVHDDMIIDHVNLLEDLSPEYREKYPDAGIKRIIKSQYCFIE